jgi:hypothetical protein
MDPRLRDLLDRLQRSGFADVKGARVSARVPVSEQLLNDVITSALPSGGAVREVRVRPRAANQMIVQLKLARPAFLPPLNVTATIERQPEFPSAPELVLKLASLPGVMSLAGGAAAFFNVLPPGIRMEGDRVAVNIAELARNHGRSDMLELVRRLHVTTEDGAIVLEVDVSV